MIRYRKLNESAYLTKLVFKKRIDREFYDASPGERESGPGPIDHYEEYEVNEAVELLGGVQFTFTIDEGSLWVEASSPKYVNPVVGIKENPSMREVDCKRESMSIWKDLNDAYEEGSLDKTTIIEIFENHHLAIYK